MLRILTVRQPWASLIVLGFKPVENRGWQTDYRGDVGILAGKGIDTDERAREAYDRHLRPIYANGLPPTPAIRALPRGGIIGVAELHDVVTFMESWWFTGPKGLMLRKPRETKNKEGKPCIIPMAGNLSMFTAHPRDEEIIRAHLDGAHV